MVLLWGFAETHKSRLMELIQKTNMPRPILIQTDNEGSDHAPQFRSHAFVGGNTFTCQRTFNRKKDSVHEVCRLVLEFIAMKFSNEPHPQLLTPTSKTSRFCGNVQNIFYFFLCVFDVKMIYYYPFVNIYT